MPFPNIVYTINLAHRTDRKDLFYKEMEKANISKEIIHRIDAAYVPSDGATGCTFSHIIALQEFIKSSHQVALICEDDFIWAEGVTADQIESLFIQLQQIPFDVCLLAGNVRKEEPTKYPFVNRVQNASTTSAYLVHRRYAEVLYKNFKDGLQLRLHHFLDKEYLATVAIDNYWKQLQLRDLWYVASPKLGLQRSDYSDIEKKCVSYNC